tara:strand:- start:594 stop:833 length:240 start_codon:yes stop_codon:yes gene_type:complete
MYFLLDTNMIDMISKLKEDWSVDPQLKQWNSKSSIQTDKCKCTNPTLVELWEQDSCVRGRIDTIVCTSCNKVKSLNIVR